MENYLSKYLKYKSKYLEIVNKNKSFLVGSGTAFSSSTSTPRHILNIYPTDIMYATLETHKGVYQNQYLPCTIFLEQNMHFDDKLNVNAWLLKYYKLFAKKIEEQKISLIVWNAPYVSFTGSQYNKITRI